MHNKYKVTFMDGTNTIIEDAELGLNFPSAAIFKIKGEMKFIIPYTAIKHIAKIDE